MRVVADIPTDPASLERALEGWIDVSRKQWREHPDWLTLYKTDVVYRREPAGRERWQTSTETRNRGEGDCEDLVIDRVAELRERHGEARARPHIYRSRSSTFHTVVRRSDGTLEDPSRILVQRERAKKAGKPMAGEDVPPGQVPKKAKVELREGPDGKHIATVAWKGEAYRVTVEAIGVDKASAVARASAIAKEIISSPALRSLIPPQAMAAVKIAGALSKLAKRGGLLGRVVGRLQGPTRALAEAMLQ